MSRLRVSTSIRALALLVATCGCARARDGGEPATEGGASAGTTRPAKLRGFRCTQPVQPGKSPRGPLAVHFAPTSPDDFTLRVEYNCTVNCAHGSGPCDYSTELRADHGKLRDGRAEPSVHCTQSSEEPFAVACGGGIGSEVEIVVKAESKSRSVRFRLPNVYEQAIPEPPPSSRQACVPFVRYDRTEGGPTWKSINLDYLSFQEQDCQFDP